MFALALTGLFFACAGHQLSASVPATTVLPMTSLPPPDTAADSDPYRAFTAFALARFARVTPGVRSASVIYDEASGLAKPRMRACRNRNYAVLIDLDPGGILFNPAEPGQGVPGLGAHLAALRAAGLRVLWLSGLTLNSTEDIQASLARTGLDPAGADRFVLRFIHERKQDLRQNTMRDYCIIALAGDRRGDFDELYDYLRDTAYANALEPMIGKGWFLVPPPIEQP